MLDERYSAYDRSEPIALIRCYLNDADVSEFEKEVMTFFLDHIKARCPDVFEVD